MTALTGEDRSALAMANARHVVAQRREMGIAETLLQLAQVAHRSHNANEIARAIVGEVARLPGIRHAAIGFWQAGEGQTVLKGLFADSRAVEERLRDLDTPRQSGFLEMLFAAKAPCVLKAERRGAALNRVVAQSGAHELLVAPLICGEQTIGALLIFGEPDYHFDACDHRLAGGVAREIAAATEKARLMWA